MYSKQCDVEIKLEIKFSCSLSRKERLQVVGTARIQFSQSPQPFSLFSDYMPVLTVLFSSEDEDQVQSLSGRWSCGYVPETIRIPWGRENPTTRKQRSKAFLASIVHLRDPAINPSTCSKGAEYQKQRPKPCSTRRNTAHPAWQGKSFRSSHGLPLDGSANRAFLLLRLQDLLIHLHLSVDSNILPQFRALNTQFHVDARPLIKLWKISERLPGTVLTQPAFFMRGCVELSEAWEVHP